MKVKSIASYDGIALRYALDEEGKDKPWIALILPFGMKLELSAPFFRFFNLQYNIVAWETRSILERSERLVSPSEFSVRNHVQDMKTVLGECSKEKYIVVGYCSGAGIALAAANRYPDMIQSLILVHGEYTLLDQKTCCTEFELEIDSVLTLARKDEEHLGSIFEKLSENRFENNASYPEELDLPFTKIEYLRRHASNYLNYKAVDFLELAKWVGHGTFLMTGERDVQANVASTKKVASVIENSQVYVDPRADHYGILRDDSPTLICIWNYLFDNFFYTKKVSL